MNEINSEWEPFDDCAICQAMDRAEKEGRSLGEKELRKAFEEQNKKPGVVGGDSMAF